MIVFTAPDADRYHHSKNCEKYQRYDRVEIAEVIAVERDLTPCKACVGGSNE